VITGLAVKGQVYHDLSPTAPFAEPLGFCKNESNLDNPDR
jgi:hypothetical protein